MLYYYSATVIIGITLLLENKKLTETWYFRRRIQRCDDKTNKQQKEGCSGV